jgi:hypothetical protein
MRARYFHKIFKAINTFSIASFALCMLLLYGCAPVIIPTIYAPRETENVKCIYSKGQAIAAVKTNDFSFLCLLDQATIGGESYFRVWLLCNNNTEAPFLLEPSEMFQFVFDHSHAQARGDSTLAVLIKSCVDPSKERFLYPSQERRRVLVTTDGMKIDGYWIGETQSDYLFIDQYSKSLVSIEKGTHFNVNYIGATGSGEDEQKRKYIINPEKPAVILNNIDNQKLMSNITAAVGGALEEMSTRPTTITSKTESGETIQSTVNDKREKQEVVREKANQSIAATSYWYDLYSGSVSEGLLRKNTVFPNRSVNGYMCFPTASVYPGLPYEYHLLIKIPNNNCDIQFAPALGE